MSSLGRRNRSALRSVSLGLLIGAVLSGNAVAAQALQKASQAPGTSEYVGADSCKTCHEEIYQGLQKTRHWSINLKTRGGAEAHDCETCHGPGAAHAEDADPKKIFSFLTASAK